MSTRSMCLPGLSIWYGYVSMYIGMCIGMYIGMCIGMCIGTSLSIVSGLEFLFLCGREAWVWGFW